MARGVFDGAGGTQGSATARGMSIEAGEMRRPPSRTGLTTKQALKLVPKSQKKKALLSAAKGAGVSAIVGGTMSVMTKPGPDAPERRGIALKKKLAEMTKNSKNSAGRNPAEQSQYEQYLKSKESLKDK